MSTIFVSFCDSVFWCVCDSSFVSPNDLHHLISFVSLHDLKTSTLTLKDVFDKIFD